MCDKMTINILMIDDDENLCKDTKELLESENIKTENKLSERFAGKLNLSNEEYNQFKKHIHNSRNEWDNRTI